jgi:hypothetical protein
VAATKGNATAAALYAAAARLAGLAAGGMAAAGAEAATLPQDRADLMYHYYSGGGVKATGPALQVRKSVGDSVSLDGSYYVDSVSSASIDVVTTASPYSERRTESGLGVEYLYRDALISVSGSRSNEPDYKAKRTNIDVAQDVFGGMTTLNLGYTLGHDDVGQHNAPNFSATADHWQYRFGLTQVLSPVWLASANYEAISDQGYLGSPYRSARVLGALQPESMPAARSSRALSLKTSVYLDPHRAVRGEYRRFWDTWGVRANQLEAAFTGYPDDKWLMETYGRWYRQGAALFYSDDFSTKMTYMTRNRQLSAFTSVGVGAKFSYTAMHRPGVGDLKLNAAYEFLHFKYDNFTDIRSGAAYSFNASVIELFASAFF